MSSNIIAVVGSNQKGTTFAPEDGSKYLMADRMMKHDFKEGEKVVILDVKQLESGLQFVTKAVRFTEKVQKVAPKPVIMQPKVIMPINPVEEAFARAMEDARKIADAVSHAKNILKIAVQTKNEQDKINAEILKKADEYFGHDSPMVGNMVNLCQEAVEKIGVEEKQHEYLLAIDQAVIATQKFGIKPFLGRSDKLDELLVTTVSTPEHMEQQVISPEPKVKTLNAKEQRAAEKKAEQEAAHQRHLAKQAKAKAEYEAKMLAEEEAREAEEAKRAEYNTKRRAQRKAKKASVVLES